MIYLIILLIISCLLIYGSWKDWNHARVPNKITYTAIVFSLLSIPFIDNLILRFIFIGFYLILFLITSIGGADIKILFAVLITTPNPFLFMSIFVISSALLLFWMRISGMNKTFSRIVGSNNKIMEEKIPGFIPITMSYIVTIAARCVWFI